MRLIGQLHRPEEAARLVDALYLRGIECQIDNAPPHRAGAGKIEVWVLDEDRLAEARAVYSRFLTMPSSGEFRDAVRQAAELRAEDESRAAEEARDLSRRAAPALEAFRIVPPRLTFGLMGAAVAMAVYLHFNPRLAGMLVVVPRMLSSWPPQLWRLVTPMFVGGGFWHLLLMLFWFHDFGAPLERAMGHRRFAGLLLVLALATGAAMNLPAFVPLSEFWQKTLFPGQWLGLGGLVYGMWGYHWGRSLREPGFSPPVNAFSPILLGIYLLLGVVGFQGPLPVGAYCVGFAVGFLLGLARRRRN